MRQTQMVNVGISITRKLRIFEAMLTLLDGSFLPKILLKTIAISDITNNFSVQPVVQKEFVAN